MTLQVPDKVQHNNKTYALLGVQGTGLPHPNDFGMRPIGITSNNYRGFQAMFTIVDQELLLSELLIADLLPNLDGTPIAFVTIHDVVPVQGDNGWVYQGLDYRTKYSGSILIGADRHEQWYGRSGALPMAYQYHLVQTLEFEDGLLLNTNDLSDDVDIWRGLIDENGSNMWRDVAPNSLKVWLDSYYS